MTSKETSKEALNTLRVNSKAFILNQGITDENDLLNIYHREAVETIEKDLELLEQIKNNLKIDCFGNIVYLPQLSELGVTEDGKPVIGTNDEKIKEWLKE